MELLMAEHQNKPEPITAEEQKNLNQTPVVRHIHRLLTDMDQPTMTNKDWEQLEEMFMQSLPHFLRLGITPIDIAQLTAHTKQSVSNTRSRLFEKAFGRKGAPTDWDQLVASL